MEDGDRRTGIGGVKTDLGPLSSDFRPLTFSGRRPMSVYACPTCPMESLLPLFHRDEMFFLFYFIGVEVKHFWFLFNWTIQTNSTIPTF